MSIEVNATEQIIEVNATGSTIDINVSTQTVDVNATTSIIEVTASYNPGINLPNGGTTGQVLKKFSNTDYDTYWATDASGLTSVGLEMPSGFVVSNSPLTSNGSFSVTGAGSTLEYIDGTGALQTFPLTLPVLQQVRNQTGSSVAAGSVVYINGATGNKPTIALAIATGDPTSAQTLGMVQTTIANNGTGYVVVIGTCGGLNTSAYTEGQQLYLSGTVAGGVTTTKPYAPTHLVYIGIVTRQHPTLGTIEVRVQNGYEMDELHNVSAQSPANNDGLFYNTSTSLWEHKQISTALGYTPGTVSSVALSVPTGLVITSGSPITTSGTIAIGLQSGYSIPTTVKQGNWDDAYTFVSGFPTQTGNSGKYLTTDGSTLSWGTVSTANIYNSDGTLTGNRTVTTSTSKLTFSDGTNGMTFKNVAPFGGLSGWYGLFGSGVTPSNTNYAFAISANGNFLALNSANGIYFNYNDSPKMYLSGSSGNFIIGGSTDAGYKLDVQGTGRFTDNIFIAQDKSIKIVNDPGNRPIISFGTTGIFGNNWTFVPNVNGGIVIASAYTTITSTSAIFEINSTTRGFLPPRMTTVQRDAISTPATGLTVYNTTLNTNDYYNGSAWVSQAAGNIYTADGTLTGNRTLTANGNSLTFLGGNEATANEQRGLILQTSATNKTSIELLLNNTFTTTGKIWRLRSLSGGDFDIVTGSSRYFYIANDGKVVVNGSSAISSAQFSVSGKIATNEGIQLQGAITSPSGSGVEIEYNGGVCYFTGYNRTASSWHPIYIRGNNILFQTAGNDRVSITNAGRLLLGTTTESTYLLDVNGTGRFTGQVSVFNDIQIDGNGKGIIFTQLGTVTKGNLTNYNWKADNVIYLQASLTGSDDLRIASSFTRSRGRLEVGNSDNSVVNGYFTGSILELGTSLTNSNTYQIRTVNPTTYPSAQNDLYIYGGVGSGNVAGDLFLQHNTTAKTGNVIIGTNVRTASAIVSIASTTQGFLPPRMTDSQKSAISSPSVGLIIYQTDGTEGLYQYKSTGWAQVAGTGGGGGITRSVNSISTPTTAGAAATTDYVYLISGTTTLTLPTAVGNTNRYTLKNVGTNTVTINTTSSQTIDGSTSLTMSVRYTALDVISDGTNWNII